MQIKQRKQSKPNNLSSWFSGTNVVFNDLFYLLNYCELSVSVKVVVSWAELLFFWERFVIMESQRFYKKKSLIFQGPMLRVRAD